MLCSGCMGQIHWELGHTDCVKKDDCMQKIKSYKKHK